MVTMSVIPSAAVQQPQKPWKSTKVLPDIRISPEIIPANEEIFYHGSSEEDSDQTRSRKRVKREQFAKDYLKHGYVPILTASLKGPFENGWKNPWAKRKTQLQTPTKVNGSEFQRAPLYVNRSTPTPSNRRRGVAGSTRIATRSPSLPSRGNAAASSKLPSMYRRDIVQVSPTTKKFIRSDIRSTPTSRLAQPSLAKLSGVSDPANRDLHNPTEDELLYGVDRSNEHNHLSSDNFKRQELRKELDRAIRSCSKVFFCETDHDEHEEELPVPVQDQEKEKTIDDLKETSRLKSASSTPGLPLKSPDLYNIKGRLSPPKFPTEPSETISNSRVDIDSLPVTEILPSLLYSDEQYDENPNLPKMWWKFFEADDAKDRKIIFDSRPVVQEDGRVDSIQDENLVHVKHILRSGMNSAQERMIKIKNRETTARTLARIDVLLQLTQTLEKIENVIELRDRVQKEPMTSKLWFDSCEKLLKAQAGMEDIPLPGHAATLAELMEKYAKSDLTLIDDHLSEQAGVVLGPDSSVHDDASNDGDVEMTDGDDIDGDIGVPINDNTHPEARNIRSSQARSEPKESIEIMGESASTPHVIREDIQSSQAGESEFSTNSEDEKFLSKMEGGQKPNFVADESDQDMENPDSGDGSQSEAINPVSHDSASSSLITDPGVGEQDLPEDHSKRGTSKSSNGSEDSAEQGSLVPEDQQRQTLKAISQTLVNRSIKTDASVLPNNVAQEDEIAVQQQLASEHADHLDGSPITIKAEYDPNTGKSIHDRNNPVIIESDSDAEIVKAATTLVAVKHRTAAHWPSDGRSNNIGVILTNRSPSRDSDVHRTIIDTSKQESAPVSNADDLAAIKLNSFSQHLDKVHQLVIKKVSQSSGDNKMISQTFTWSDSHPVRAVLALNCLEEGRDIQQRLSNDIFAGAQQAKHFDPDGSSAEHLATQHPPLKWASTTEEEQNSLDHGQNGIRPSPRSSRFVSFGESQVSAPKADILQQHSSQKQPADSTPFKPTPSAAVSQNSISKQSTKAPAPEFSPSRTFNTSTSLVDLYLTDAQRLPAQITDEEEKEALDDAQAFLGVWNVEKESFLKSA